MVTPGDDPWARYEFGETLEQHQRISRTAAKSLPSGMAVWIDKLAPYYGDHPEGLKAATEYLSRQTRVTHPVLPCLIDAWEQEGALCWVYRVQQGTPLGEYVAGHLPSVPALKPLIVDLSEGLAALHGAGLFHGNLQAGGVLISGKRRLVLTRRGIRSHLNRILNQSPLEEAINTTLEGGPSDDIALWGEMLGVFLTGESHFGRIIVSSHAVGVFDLKLAEETFHRKGIGGRLPEVVLRACKAKESPGESYMTMAEALEAFLDGCAHDSGVSGGHS